MPEWESLVEKCSQSENLLRKQNYEFPLQWREFYILEGEWSKLQKILREKSLSFEEQRESIIKSIRKEEEMVLKKIQDLEQTWGQKQLCSGNKSPKEALQALDLLNKREADCRMQTHSLNQVQQLMELPLTIASQLNSLKEDIALLRQLWENISPYWTQSKELLEKTILRLDFSQTKQRIEEGIQGLESVPSKYKSYDIFSQQKQTLLDLRKSLPVLELLSGEAIKEHHWGKICRLLLIDKRPSQVLIEDVLKTDVSKQMKNIQAILDEANGELVVEKILQKIKEFWAQETFQFVSYKNQIDLIKGWDQLLTQTEDDNQQLNSLKLSQHFKLFEEEIKQWLERLQGAQNVLDLWMEVQKKWVYLQNIFSSSGDIQFQLP